MTGPGESGGPPAPRPLADAVPGAVAPTAFGNAGGGPPPSGPPPGAPPPNTGFTPPGSKRPSGLNGPAYALIGLALLTAILVLWPQLSARAIERRAKPLLTELAGRDVSARCPRYVTSMFGRAGSVSLDSDGNISDHTDLTKPICDGLKRALSKDGRAELACLTTPRGYCSTEARQSVVALMVTTHEAMHLRGIMDEAAAECGAITYAPKMAKAAFLTPEQGRVMAWIHWQGLNPNTPSQYRINEYNCKAAADLAANPPGTPDQLSLLEMTTASTWAALSRD